jgi:hypothetical protein
MGICATQNVARASATRFEHRRADGGVVGGGDGDPDHTETETALSFLMEAAGGRRHAAAQPNRDASPTAAFGAEDRAAAGRGPAERLFNQPPQSRIATSSIVVIEFHLRSGQSSDIVGGSKRAADSS